MASIAPILPYLALNPFSRFAAFTTSLKTASHNFNDLILLLCAHFDIAGRWPLGRATPP